MTDLLTYIILIWVELTVFAVILPIVGLLVLGRLAKIQFVLHIMRTKFIIHYIRTTNGRLITQVALDKDVKTFGHTQFIPYKGFWYKVDQSKFFLSGTDFAIAHKFNVAEPLEFSTDNINLFDDKTNQNQKYTAQETESAITSKVVLDLNKSIYTNKDLFLIIIMLVGIGIGGINLYFNYENTQLLTSISNFLSHLTGTGTPTP